jgi:hypothetical protein
VPVSFVNPSYAEDFVRSVAVHEFAHMLQFRLRRSIAGAHEPWFWEASAEWTAEHAAPDLDTYALSTRWYAARPDDRFDSVLDQHDYGMLLFDAWLDEDLVGFDGIRDAWVLSGDRPEATWDAILAESTGEDFGTMIAEMSGAVAAGALRELALYEAPVRAATFAEAPERATIDRPFLFGTAYVEVDAAAPGFAVEGPVEVRYAADGTWGDEVPDGPFVAAITASADEGDVTVGTGLGEEDEAPTRRGCGGGRALGGIAWVLVGRRKKHSIACPPGSARLMGDGRNRTSTAAA